jgi:hypothetical protein
LDLDFFFSNDKREKNLKRRDLAMSIDFKLIHNMTPETQKSWFIFTSQQFKHLSERDVSKIQDGHHNWLCKNIQETTLSWTLFRKIIWNRDIIMLVIRLIELDEKFKTKHVLLKFKVFEKIKQVSSTKLTNWYKNISRWKN